MKKIIFLAILVSLLVGCFNKELTKLDDDAIIIAFGDSLTYGYGASQFESYPVVLQNLINRKVINEGVNGNSTTDGLNRIKQVLNENKPDLIIIGLGGNDMLRKIPDNKIKENLDKMIKIAKEKQSQVVLLATPKPSLMGLITNLDDAEFYKEVAKENGVHLIEDIYSKWLSEEEYKSDPVHLNAKGYQKVAEEIADFLESKGAI